MNSRYTPVFAMLAFVLLIVDHASAQSKTAKTLLNGWDRNKDGFLEKSEIPEVAREKVYDLAKRNGLDTSKALPVGKLLAKPGVQTRAEKAKDVKKSPSETILSAGKKATKEGEATKTKEARSKSSDAKPGKFSGDAPRRGKVAGFGNNEQPQAAKGKSTAEDPKDKAKKSADTSARRRLKFLAKSMLAQHDRNKNGKLEKSEWSRIRGNPGASDRDRNGVLTAEELEQHLGGFATQEKDRRPLGKSTAATRSKRTSSRKTYRFLTAHERLPKGLPSWYTGRDENLDGQITLREFAPRISQAKLDQFQSFDLNGDGFIVPQEYLKSLE